jgi:hypothetical protein
MPGDLMVDFDRHPYDGDSRLTMSTYLMKLRYVRMEIGTAIFGTTIFANGLKHANIAWQLTILIRETGSILGLLETVDNSDAVQTNSL